MLKMNNKLRQLQSNFAGTRHPFVSTCPITDAPISDRKSYEQVQFLGWYHPTQLGRLFERRTFALAYSKLRKRFEPQRYRTILSA